MKNRPKKGSTADLDLAKASCILRFCCYGQCKHEDAGADKRACVMHNLILHNGNLTYLYSGAFQSSTYVVTLLCIFTNPLEPRTLCT